MKQLNYELLNEINYNGYINKGTTERMLQFGEGNFLRSFVDYFVDEMNEKADFDCKVVVCQPIKTGLCDAINEQEGLYTLYLRGSENGEKIVRKKIISSISRCINPYSDFNCFLDIAKNPDLKFIASNTTEAGISYDNSAKFSDAPPQSFPAKLTRFMYERYINFKGDENKGFIILSCELIENNGDELKRIVLKHAKDWDLEEKFIEWIKNNNEFCSTLVDRIATGYPKDIAHELNTENGYIDKLIDTAEIFGFWVIEGNEKVKNAMPFAKANLPILVTEDHSSYKQRKVAILNGAHTALVMGAYLSGKKIVRECMEDDVMKAYINKLMFDEIIPILSLDKNDVTDFANSVIDRFLNPFIDHELLSITLNSTSKLKARILPSLLAYYNNFGKIPKCLSASFAFYIAFYQKGVDTMEYDLSDDKSVIDFYSEYKNLNTMDLVKKVCQHTEFWGMDLTTLTGFEDDVFKFMNSINTIGTYEVMKQLVE